MFATNQLAIDAAELDNQKNIVAGESCFAFIVILSS
jgi:hypothetical protein